MERKILQAYALMSDGSVVQIETPRRGHWVTKAKTHKDGRAVPWREYECSECDTLMLIKTPFCPECGAKMEEPGKDGERRGK